MVADGLEPLLILMHSNYEPMGQIIALLQGSKVVK
jgi:hypothetical protein